MVNTNACNNPSKIVKKHTISMFMPVHMPSNSNRVDPCSAVKYNLVMMDPPNMFPNKRNDTEMTDDSLPIILRGNIMKNGLKKSVIYVDNPRVLIETTWI